MLAHLRVRDLVLIDELDLSLSRGLNVLTGETGAGKSLVATAMDLLLGRRGSGELVRRGAEAAEVEGLFDISDEPDIKARLAEAGIPQDDELLVRRVIPGGGRHRCYVNGRLASLTILSQLAEGLARVTSQHEQHTLSEPASRLALLDGFGKLEPSVARMGALFDAYQADTAALDGLMGKVSDRSNRLDYLKYQMDEIDRVSPAFGELDRLTADIERHRHQALLSSTATGAAAELYENDRSIFERLGAIVAALETARLHDPALGGTTEELRDAAALVEDAARFLGRYAEGVEADPGALEEMEDRLEALKSLTRKHGADLDGVIALRDRMAEECAVLTDFDDAMEEARKKVTASREAAEECAVGLSAQRKRAARELGKAVAAELRDLMFPSAGFKVTVEPSAKGLSRTGQDAVDFMVSLNPGEGAHSLQKVASGGELSRLMLAVKRALAGVGPVGTYIFDEVDAGISGPVAASVGRKLKEVARHHQVICITHLPQIAGMADAHFHVSKVMEDGRTRSAVRHLDDADRVEEVSRMLAGDQITDKTRAAAKELIA